ncbi:thioesterase family protein [Alkalinema sp. FACHB-956]|uniref:acyl-CoA thioesterase n=1 Tax=Alkalinema sp. FACHB-956 TaxID=2692768 RepID=UPI0016882A6B|nr:thioesterase family protein [Alkalinema sp. FACHB-956]MBD2326209.1 acyl-CoA thioesterase [Alkalinema sp. FACHB-956]
MGFIYDRTIRFSDTDAAGVVYFANGLNLCHEAYEASLQASGINLRTFFSAGQTVAFPIVHASIDFRRPMHCGDRIQVHLQPRSISESEYEIQYQIFIYENTVETGSTPLDTPPPRSTFPVATAITRHVCIDTLKRKHQPYTTAIKTWLSMLGGLDDLKA